MIYVFILIVPWLYLLVNAKRVNKIRGRKASILQRYQCFIPVFIFLAFFAAIRDDCGCDYNSYVNHIISIQSGKLNYMEPGFQEVVRQFNKINDNPRLVIIFFGVLTTFFYLLAIWNQSTNKALSVFIFLSWGYYFMTYNTIRNYFALSFVLCTLPLLVKKKHLLFILLILFASLFHKSALFCIPAYYLANRLTLKRKHILPLVALTFVLLFLERYLRTYAFLLYSTYEGSDFDTGRISVLNILKAVLAIALYLLYRKRVRGDKLCKLYFNLNVFALILYTGVYWIPEISRLGFYLNASVIFLVPRILGRLSPKNRKQLRILFYLGSALLFVLLLHQFSSETTRLLPYKTWLFNGTYNQY